jgi:hypothetical protein
MAGTGDNTGSNCRSRSGIPVVSRKGRHRSSGVSEAGFTLCIKVFHFLDARRHRHHHHPTPPTQARVIQPGSSSQGHPEPGSSRARVIQPGSSRQGHQLKITHTHTPLVFCFCFVSHHTSHTYLQL